MPPAHAQARASAGANEHRALTVWAPCRRSLIRPPVRLRPYAEPRRRGHKSQARVRPARCVRGGAPIAISAAPEVYEKRRRRPAPPTYVLSLRGRDELTALLEPGACSATRAAAFHPMNSGVKQAKAGGGADNCFCPFDKSEGRRVLWRRCSTPTVPAPACALLRVPSRRPRQRDNRIGPRSVNAAVSERRRSSGPPSPARDDGNAAGARRAAHAWSVRDGSRSTGWLGPRSRASGTA